MKRAKPSSARSPSRRLETRMPPCLRGDKEAVDIFLRHYHRSAVITARTCREAMRVPGGEILRPQCLYWRHAVAYIGWLINRNAIRKVTRDGTPTTESDGTGGGAAAGGASARAADAPRGEGG